jgi:ketopantoate hydroxymethyltransferase
LPLEVTSLILKKPCVRQSNHERKWRPCCKAGRWKEIKESIKKILNAGIPVMGHLGLTPQSIYKFGTYTVRAKEEEEADKLVEDAKLLERLGCFALVLEKSQHI